MSADITSKQLILELDTIITNYINSAKKSHRNVTRDDVIEMLTDKLKEIMGKSDNKDRTLVISGMAVGMAMVLQIEEKLKEI